MCCWKIRNHKLGLPMGALVHGNLCGSNSFNSSVRERKRHAEIAWLERIQLRTFSSAIAPNRNPEHPVRIESWMASSFISNVMDTVNFKSKSCDAARSSVLTCPFPRFCRNGSHGICQPWAVSIVQGRSTVTRHVTGSEVKIIIISNAVSIQIDHHGLFVS